MTSIPPPGQPPVGGGRWSYAGSKGAPNPVPHETSSSLDPLSRRLLSIAGGLAVLLVLLVAFAWLHGSSETSLNPIAEAAVRTQRQPGSRLALRGVYTLPAGQSMTMRGSGVYNGRTGRTRYAMSMEVPGSLSHPHIDALGSRHMVYMRSKVLTAGLPPGDRWLAFQPGLGGSAEAAMAGNTDSRGQLEMLRAAGGDVETLGPETVHGAPTTRYRGSVDFRHYAELLRGEGKATAANEYVQLAKRTPGPIPVEAWLDGSGLLRRMRMVMDVPSSPGAPLVKMDLTMEFFDFGAAPSVRLPNAREVFDSTPLARAQLHLLDGSATGINGSASGGPPLALAAFQKRTARVCEDLVHRIHPFALAARGLKARLDRAKRLGGAGDPRALGPAMRTYSLRVFEPVIRLATKAMRHLATLPPPPSVRASFRRYLHFSAISIEINLAQARALELGSFKLARQLEPRRHAVARLARREDKRAKLGNACEDSESSS
jgi:hypothetical protein